jgi:hypothetical protein
LIAPAAFANFKGLIEETGNQIFASIYKVADVLRSTLTVPKCFATSVADLVPDMAWETRVPPFTLTAKMSTKPPSNRQEFELNLLTFLNHVLPTLDRQNRSYPSIEADTLLFETGIVASIDRHRSFFGQRFSIRTSDGAFAHSACIAFGLERWKTALLAGKNVSGTEGTMP